MTAFEVRFVFDRVASVAALQEQMRNSLKIVATGHSFRLSAAEAGSISFR
jgi:hypothetical protein